MNSEDVFDSVIAGSADSIKTSLGPLQRSKSRYIDNRIAEILTFLPLCLYNISEELHIFWCTQGHHSIL